MYRLLRFFAFFLFFANAHSDTSLPYRFDIQSYDEYGTKGRILTLYNASNKPVLHITLEEISGGCGERSFEKAVYRLNRRVLSVYTRWKHEAYAKLAPEGYRIQRYRLDDNGSVTFLGGTLYIEDPTIPNAEETLPLSPRRLTTLTSQTQRYIDAAQARYHAAFVSTFDAWRRLKKEVTEALKRQARARWK